MLKYKNRNQLRDSERLKRRGVISKFMGKYKFRLSDMISNAWFYKLKNTSMTRNRNASTTTPPIIQKLQTITRPHSSPHRFEFDGIYSPLIIQTSSHIHNPEPARKSSKKRAKTSVIYKPTHSVGIGTKLAKPTPIDSPHSFVSSIDGSPTSDSHEYSSSSEANASKVDSLDPYYELNSWSSSYDCRLSSSTNDIIIDINTDESFSRKSEKIDGFNIISEVELELPPILTKPQKFSTNSSRFEELKTEGSSLSVRITKKENIKIQEDKEKNNLLVRTSSSNATGIKLRTNTPKLAMGSRKIQSHGRKSVSSTKKVLSGSFAVVRASIDPEKDFRESMVEMIVENNIRASKELEVLLGCYLKLNSEEYHDMIVKAFEKIWFHMG